MKHKLLLYTFIQFALKMCTGILFHELKEQHVSVYLKTRFGCICVRKNNIFPLSSSKIILFYYTISNMINVKAKFVDIFADLYIKVINGEPFHSI